MLMRVLALSQRAERAILLQRCTCAFVPPKHKNPPKHVFTVPPPSGSSGCVSAAHVFTTCLILLQIQTRRLRWEAPIAPQERDRGLQKNNRT